jgi:hypothetical protein
VSETEKRLHEALRAVAALAGAPLSEADLERLGPDLARVAVSLETLRAVAVEGYEPAFLAPPARL